MLEKLSNVLKKTTDKIANAIFLDKNLVDSIVKDLQRALIEADVNVSLVLELTKKIKQAALGERIKGIEKKEHIIKLLHDELISILGQSREIKLQKKNTFLFVGLYGQGKTTTISKIASYYAKRGSKVCAIGLDVHRPAAPEQLKQLCDKLNIKCFINKEEKNPIKIWNQYRDELKDYDLVLIDSAGRDALSKDLIKEIKDISKLTKPTETFLVMAADVGQAAKKQAQAFKESCNITGAIITRMDSTAKAGGALTACAEVRAPVVFLGVGEKSADLETFDPESFLSRLLGMGDLKALIEKIHSVVDKDKMEKTQKALEEGKFTLDTFSEQLDSMSEMGSFDKLLGMVPGLGNVKDKIPQEQLELQQEKVKHWKAAIKSITKEEKENPELLEKETSRMARIAKGSGTHTSDIRMLLKQYKMLNELIKSQSTIAEKGLDQKTMMKLARKFGRKMKF
ncbi:signal recognition particle receptor subunit alpha [Candidatus Pacearchaeota archaeon]|nr:signal recognition particle receptor subunit alpha [Candidatus Pacearchaeota archaeon]